MSSKSTQFTLLRVKKRQKTQSSFQKRDYSALYLFGNNNNFRLNSNQYILLGCVHVCYPNRESQKNFNGVHKTSKVKVVANVRFIQLRPDLQAGHLSEGSRDLKAWWSKRHPWSWKALGKKMYVNKTRWQVKGSLMVFVGRVWERSEM